MLPHTHVFECATRFFGTGAGALRAGLALGRCDIQRNQLVPSSLHFDSTSFSGGGGTSIGRQYRASSFIAVDYSLVSDRSGKSLFRSFFTEANVSFNPDRIAGVTTRELDPTHQVSARSGSDLAQEVTQRRGDVLRAD